MLVSWNLTNHKRIQILYHKWIFSDRIFFWMFMTYILLTFVDSISSFLCLSTGNSRCWLKSEISEFNQFFCSSIANAMYYYPSSRSHLVLCKIKSLRVCMNMHELPLLHFERPILRFLQKCSILFCNSIIVPSHITYWNNV